MPVHLACVRGAQLNRQASGVAVLVQKYCRALAILSLALVAGAAQAMDGMPTMNVPAIEQLVAQMATAWNAGDAGAFAGHFQADGTFTNVNGTTFKGKEAFEQRHRDIFAGPLKGSRTAMTIRELRLLRADVAVANVDCLTTMDGRPPIESRLLLVLTNESGQWGIASFHNTAVQAAPIVK